MGSKGFIWYFLYLIIFVFSTFNGISILKTKSFRSPYGRRKFVEGTKAIFVGIILILTGLLSLVVFIIGFKKFLF